MSTTITLNNSELQTILNALNHWQEAKKGDAHDENGLRDLMDRLSTTGENIGTYWSVDDAFEIVNEDEETEHLDSKAIKRIAQRFLHITEDGLLDIVAGRGGDYLLDRWHRERERLIEEEMEQQTEAARKDETGKID